MEFSTQRELLEYLGKNGDDRRLVQRLISRGSVIKEDGMYILVDKDEEIKKLKARIFFLENECSKNTTECSKNTTERSENTTEGKNTGLEDLMGKLESMESDLEFQIKENERLERKVLMYQEAIRKCYLWARNVKKDKTPWPEFKKDVLKLEEDLPGEDNQ